MEAIITNPTLRTNLSPKTISPKTDEWNISSPFTDAYDVLRRSTSSIKEAIGYDQFESAYTNAGINFSWDFCGIRKFGAFLDYSIIQGLRHVATTDSGLIGMIPQKYRNALYIGNEYGFSGISVEEDQHTKLAFRSGVMVGGISGLGVAMGPLGLQMAWSAFLGGKMIFSQEYRQKTQEGIQAILRGDTAAISGLFYGIAMNASGLLQAKILMGTVLTGAIKQMEEGTDDPTVLANLKRFETFNTGGDVATLSYIATNLAVLGGSTAIDSINQQKHDSLLLISEKNTTDAFNTFTGGLNTVENITHTVTHNSLFEPIITNEPATLEFNNGVIPSDPNAIEPGEHVSINSLLSVIHKIEGVDTFYDQITGPGQHLHIGENQYTVMDMLTITSNEISVLEQTINTYQNLPFVDHIVAQCYFDNGHLAGLELAFLQTDNVTVEHGNIELGDGKANLGVNNDDYKRIGSQESVLYESDQQNVTSSMKTYNTPNAISDKIIPILEDEYSYTPQGGEDQGAEDTCALHALYVGISLNNPSYDIGDEPNDYATKIINALRYQGFNVNEVVGQNGEVDNETEYFDLFRLLYNQIFYENISANTYKEMGLDSAEFVHKNDILDSKSHLNKAQNIAQFYIDSIEKGERPLYTTDVRENALTHQMNVVGVVEGKTPILITIDTQEVNSTFDSWNILEDLIYYKEGLIGIPLNQNNIEMMNRHQLILK